MKNERVIKTIYLDIMIGEKFYDQLTYRYCPIFKIDGEEIRKYVEEKRPLLKHKEYDIHFSNERVLR